MCERAPSGCSGFDNHDADTEVGEASLIVPNEVLTLYAVEVLSTKFTIFHAVPKNVPGGDQDRMGDRDDGLLVTTSLGKPAILRGEVAVAFTNGATGAFHKRRA
jgi:hypothetical protein